jgi:predicted nucleic acid-binding protein
MEKTALLNAHLRLERLPVEGTPQRELLTMARALALDSGEIAALVVMSTVPQALFLTDDAAARVVAQEMGYSVHGTLGVLVRAIRRSMLPKDVVLERLRSIPEKSTLYIRPALLLEVIRQVEAGR